MSNIQLTPFFHTLRSCNLRQSPVVTERRPCSSILRVVDLFSQSKPRSLFETTEKSFKMKLSTAVIATALCQSALAFSPAASARKSMALKGFDLSGNSWKPDSEKMGSTDTGDYFPEGYDPNEIAFTEGWQGSQELLVDKDRGGPQL